MKIYLAGPLFTMSEIEWNRTLSAKLKHAGFDTFLPQKECEGKENREIFEICRNGIDSCDIVLGNVDGTDADSGTCWEIGYAYAKGKKVYLYRTDFRKYGDDGHTNLMLSYGCELFFVVKKNIDEIVETMIAVRNGDL